MHHGFLKFGLGRHLASFPLQQQRLHGIGCWGSEGPLGHRHRRRTLRINPQSYLSETESNLLNDLHEQQYTSYGGDGVPANQD